MTINLRVSKSEILFLYESTFSIPNGDPFTGEQRYDDETKKVLVSDVRIKRFIRDYFIDHDYEVYLTNSGGIVTSEKRMELLKNKYDKEAGANKKEKSKNGLSMMKKCLDVRLFGGISTEKGDSVNLTGAVQFALLNPSLNAVDLRIHQNTSVFSSTDDKKRGAIGTTTIVPYCINQIHGWINPYSAVHTDLTQEDINLMCEALWNSVNNANTRSKSNQNSLLLLQIVYQKPTDKLYGLDKLIKLISDKQGEQLRSSEDYTLDFSGINQATSVDKVLQVNFYTENQQWKEELEKIEKFSLMLLV